MKTLFIVAYILWAFVLLYQTIHICHKDGYRTLENVATGFAVMTFLFLILFICGLL